MWYIIRFLFRVWVVILWYTMMPIMAVFYTIFLFKLPPRDFLKNDWVLDRPLLDKHYYKNAWKFLINRKSVDINIYDWNQRIEHGTTSIDAPIVAKLRVNYKKNIKRE